MRWALINGSKVANVVTQDDQPTIPGTWIACGNAGIGWDWHGGTSFTNPSQHTAPAWTDPDLAPAYWHIDVGSFMDRFGSKALALASSSDPAVQGLITLLMPRKYIEDIQEDVEEIQEDIDEIQEDVEDIQEDVEDIQEDEDQEDTHHANDDKVLGRIEETLGKLIEEINELKKNSKKD
jgi:hypothetical protein